MRVSGSHAHFAMLGLLVLLRIHQVVDTLRSLIVFFLYTLHLDPLFYSFVGLSLPRDTQSALQLERSRRHLITGPSH
jgi:hypothetical protein